MRYAYQRGGAPLIQWPGRGRNSAPPQSRAADARSLGSLGDDTLSTPTLAGPTLVLPAPGAPEPLNGDCGCGCKGAGTCGGGMGHDGIGDIGDAISAHPVIAAGLAYVAWRVFFKKKRR